MTRGTQWGILRGLSVLGSVQGSGQAVRPWAARSQFQPGSLGVKQDGWPDPSC